MHKKAEQGTPWKKHVKEIHRSVEEDLQLKMQKSSKRGGEHIALDEVWLSVEKFLGRLEMQ